CLRSYLPGDRRRLWYLRSCSLRQRMHLDRQLCQWMLNDEWHFGGVRWKRFGYHHSILSCRRVVIEAREVV
ncbi:hypothetical protein KXV68_002359, partial [Aspergillus fumigatus]